MRNSNDKFNQADRRAIKYWAYGFVFLALVTLMASHTFANWPISATQTEATGSIAKPAMTPERLMLEAIGQVP
jgi:hypothetical protein